MITVAIACPVCGEDVLVAERVAYEAAWAPEAHYPGHAASVEVSGEGSRCRCGHYLEVDDHAAAIVAALEDT